MHRTRASLGRAVRTAHRVPHVPCGAPQALPVSALPPVSELQRQAHRLMLAQGSATKELSHVGHVQWLNSQIPMRIPLLLQPQERA